MSDSPQKFRPVESATHAIKLTRILRDLTHEHLNLVSLNNSHKKEMSQLKPMHEKDTRHLPETLHIHSNSRPVSYKRRRS